MSSGLNQISGFYCGCVDSGNMGDDVLFPIFIKMLANSIEKKYNIKCSLINNRYPINNEWGKISDIGVIGGGSVIHPEEISYTLHIEKNKDTLRSSFLFGTGICDTGNFRIPEKNRDLIIRGDFSDIQFPNNNHMLYNIKIANDCLFGGLRGPLDVEICRSFNSNFNKNYIGDPGLLASKYIKFIKKQSQNLIGINFGDITHDSKISIINESYSDYINRLKTVIVNFCKYLISLGYNLFFYSMSEGEIGTNISLINEIKKDFPDSDISTHTNVLTPEELLELCSTFKIAIASRLHANILANSVLCPTINLMYNIKAINYMESIELRKYGIPTNTELTLENLITKFTDLENNYINVINKLEEKINFYDLLYNNEFTNMLNKLNLKIKSNINIEYFIYSKTTALFKIY
jgi:hypothetical protein